MSCSESTGYQKRIINTKPLGKRWGKIVEDLVMKEGATLARAQLKAGKQATADEVVVQIPVTIYVGFPRRGRGIAGTAGIARAVCTFKQDEAGSVCICVGPGADTCSCNDAGGPPIVA